MKIAILVVVVLMVLLAIRLLTLGRTSRGMPANAGLIDGKLRPCESAGNCVISTTNDERSSIPHLKVPGTPQERAKILKNAINRTEGVVVTQSDVYIHAEYTSKRMGYVDDLELLIDPNSDRVDVRSASRVGKSDLGANRARVEQLRSNLGQK